MTPYNSSSKHYLSILALSLLVSACSSLHKTESEDTLPHPKELVIESSIISAPPGKRMHAISELESKDEIKVSKPQSSEKIIDIGGFGALEQAAKIPPIFENNEKVTISVDSMSVSDFIHYVFGDLLGLNYVVSSQLDGNKKQVSLNLTDPITKEKLYTTSEELLGENDIAMLRKDNIVYFQKKKQR